MARLPMILRGVLLALSVLALVACTVSAVAAQESATDRARLIGRVVDADNKPWPKARVRLISRAMGILGWGETDEVRVDADERGRFRAMLLAGRTYSAWAVGVQESDRRFASHVVENAQAGIPLKLVRDDYARLATELRLRRQMGAPDVLRLHALCVTQNPYSVEVPEVDGVHVLPTLPGRSVWLEARDEKGQVHAVQHLYLTAIGLSRKDEANVAKPGSFEHALNRVTAREISKQVAQRGHVRRRTLLVRRPQHMKFEVRDAGSGKPIAGATVLGRISYSVADGVWDTEGAWRTFWLEIGKSKANGECRIDVPAAVFSTGQYWTDPTFAVRADGYAMHLLEGEGLRRKSGFDRFMDVLRKRQPEAVKSLKFALRPGHDFDARFSGGGTSTLAAKRPLVLEAATLDNDGDYGFSWLIPTSRQRLVTDAKGGFRVRGLRSGQQYLLKTAVDAALLERVGVEGVPLPCPTAIVGLGVVPKDGAEQRFDLASLRAITLAVRTADGRPARECRVTLVPEWTDVTWGQTPTQMPLRAVADRQGRARFLAGRGKYGLLLVDERGREFAVRDVEVRGQHLELEIPLASMRAFAGKVVDLNGVSISGASIRPEVFDFPSRALLLELIEEYNERSLVCQSDENGAFRAFFIPWKKGTFEIEVDVDTRAVEASAEFKFAFTDEKVGDVRLQLECVVPDRKKK